MLQNWANGPGENRAVRSRFKMEVSATCVHLREDIVRLAVMLIHLFFAFQSPQAKRKRAESPISSTRLTDDPPSTATHSAHALSVGAVQAGEPPQRNNVTSPIVLGSASRGSVSAPRGPPARARSRSTSVPISARKHRSLTSKAGENEGVEEEPKRKRRNVRQTETLPKNVDESGLAMEVDEPLQTVGPHAQLSSSVGDVRDAEHPNATTDEVLRTRSILGDRSNIPRAALRVSLVHVPPAVSMHNSARLPVRAKSSTATSQSSVMTAPRVTINRHSSLESATRLRGRESQASRPQVFQDKQPAAVSTMDLEALSSALPKVPVARLWPSSVNSSPGRSAEFRPVERPSPVSSDRDVAHVKPACHLPLPSPSDCSAIAGVEGDDHSSIVVESDGSAIGLQGDGQADSTVQLAYEREPKVGETHAQDIIHDDANLDYEADGEEGEDDEGDITVQMPARPDIQNESGSPVQEQRLAQLKAEQGGFDGPSNSMSLSMTMHESPSLGIRDETIDASTSPVSNSSKDRHETSSTIIVRNRDKLRRDVQVQHVLAAATFGGKFRMPPRLPRLPLMTPRETGPLSDEDDLEYAIKTTGTHSSEDDDDDSADDADAMRRAESEIGIGFRANNVSKRGRQRILLRDDEMPCVTSDAEDELALA